MNGLKFRRGAALRWPSIAAAAMFASSAACGAPPSPTVKIKFKGSYNPVTCSVVEGNENKTVHLPTIST
ncbi:type 1 fimbrial protein, partial [Burkholderia pseudomallei]